MLDRASSNLADNIKRLREARGLTQQELAEVSGVPRPTIANLESGGANPTLLVLLKVADALGATIEKLVGAYGRGAAITVHRGSELPERSRGGGKIRRLMTEGFRPIELERVEIAPAGRVTVRAEPSGSREMLACELGELEISAGADAARLATGDVAVVAADRPREYANPGKRTVVAYRIVATLRD